MSVNVTVVDDLPARLKQQDVDLRIVDSLLPLRAVWNTTLQASGIRLRNATGWNNAE